MAIASNDDDQRGEETKHEDGSYVKSVLERQIQVVEGTVDTVALQYVRPKTEEGQQRPYTAVYPDQNDFVDGLSFCDGTLGLQGVADHIVSVEKSSIPVCIFNLKNNSATLSAVQNNKHIMCLAYFKS